MHVIFYGHGSFVQFTSDKEMRGLNRLGNKFITLAETIHVLSITCNFMHKTRQIFKARDFSHLAVAALSVQRFHRLVLHFI